MNKKIIHIDMDAFFAAVEQRDHPDLMGKPIAVGGSKRRGVVAAASYEAREFGVHSAMPSVIAARKCPELIFVKGNFKAYKEASSKIMSIFREYTDLVEPLSLDEAYLDVTNPKINISNSATLIAEEIRKRIKSEVNLTASAGVSINKFLAKIASDYKKPDGLYVIKPKNAVQFIDTLAIGKIPGIGKVTEKKMHKYNIFIGRDLKNSDLHFLTKQFGKMGKYYFDLLHLKYNSPVTTDRIRKSYGASRTFERDISDINIMEEKLLFLSDKLEKQMSERKISGRTITLRIKYHDFQVNTRSKTLEHYISTSQEILRIGMELLIYPLKPIKSVRLLGIQISSLNINAKSSAAEQLSLNF